MKFKPLVIFTLVFSLLTISSYSGVEEDQRQRLKVNPNGKELNMLNRAYFASGCFWCVEAIFECVKGVKEVVSGYSGGQQENPTYQEVSSGKSRHAEAVEVYYDPKEINFSTLLEVFFGSHDPTTLNQQGPDIGPQYRSAVFYQNEEEKKLTEEYIKILNASGQYENRIVTEVVAFDKFYKAEDYHQDYEKIHPNNPYVQRISIPRLRKFEAKFPKLLKEIN